MKKNLLLAVSLCVFSGQLTAETLNTAYQDFKSNLQKDLGLSYSIDASFLPQRGAPNGSKTAWQSQYYTTANWDMFNSSTIGQGSVQMAYTAVRYWGVNANYIGNKIGVISSINDYTAAENNFDQLSYTHVLPGKMDDFSITLGQFPLYNFDGGDYNANQQINFLNFALSQNASSVYPTASLGGYLTFAPNSQWSFSAGLQDANNITGQTISTHDFGKGNYTSFISATWSPKLFGQPAQYSILLYNQPSVSDQPIHSKGWSVNLQQNITDKVALFGRINGTNQNQDSISQSYVLGGVINNPLGRNDLDQIGLAAAFNKLNETTNGAGTRAWENVLEAYWAWGFSQYLTLTPDIQFYINPGLNTDQKTATVVSLRATFMF